MDLILFGILNKRIKEVAKNAGGAIIIDTSLTQSGQAADAKAVGDRLAELLQTTETLGEKLENLPIASGDSVVKVLKVNGAALEIDEDGVVNIPVATEEIFGVVKSTSEDDGVSVNEDGTMKVNNISFSKIVQKDDDEFVFVGGDSDL